MSKTQPDKGALSDFRITFRLEWRERVLTVVLSGGGCMDSFSAGGGGSSPARMSVRITADAVSTLRRMEAVISVERIH